MRARVMTASEGVNEQPPEHRDGGQWHAALLLPEPYRVVVFRGRGKQHMAHDFVVKRCDPCLCERRWVEPGIGVGDTLDWVPVELVDASKHRSASLKVRCS